MLSFMKLPQLASQTHTLDNGLTLLLNSDTKYPVINAQICVETGSCYEANWLGAGISHFLEHYVFKGTKSFSKEELTQSVENLGGQWNAYTSFDHTLYYLNGPSKQARYFLDLLTELVFEPKFPDNEFTTEQEVITREMAMYNDDPDSVAFHLCFETLFQIDPRRYPIIGYPDSFAKIKLADLKNYHNLHYHPNNCFLSISGDFDPQQIIDHVESITTHLPKKAVIKPSLPTEPSQIAKRVSSHSFSVSHQLTNICWQIPPFEHTDTPTLDLLSSILGQGKSSRLYQRLRQKDSLCYSVSSDVWTSSQTCGVFSIQAELDTNKQEAFLSSLADEIKQVTQSVRDEELEKIKTAYLHAQFKQMQTASNRASQMTSQWLKTKSLSSINLYWEKLSQVTSQQIQIAAKHYLKLEQATFSCLTPKSVKTASKPTQMTKQTASPKRLKLSSGLTLILNSHDDLPIASLCLASIGGKITETSNNSGITYLISSLLNQGTSQYDAKNIAEQLDKRGVQLNISTGNQTQIISASSLNHHLEWSLEFIHHLLFDSQFNQNNIDQETTILVQNLKQISEDPLKTAINHLKSALFQNQAYGTSSEQLIQSIPQLKRQQLIDHHQLSLDPKQWMLSIDGSFCSSSLIEKIENTFQATANNDKPNLAKIKASPQASQHIQLNKEQAVIAIGFPGVCVGTKEALILELFQKYISSMAGPLFQKIREELGLAYYVNCSQFQGIKTGMFYFYLGTSPEKINLAEESLLNEIQLFANQSWSRKTVEKMKTSWISAELLSRQSASYRCQSAALDQLLCQNHLLFEERVTQIQKMYSQDIQNALKQVFNAQPTKIIVTKEAS